jgi:hypothetical protein
MPRPSILTLILAGLLGLAGCGGDSHEALATETVDVMQEFGDTLAKITDRASAEEHKAELEEHVADMNDLKARMDKMGDPSPEKGAELEKKFEKEMGPAMQKMMSEMMRIAQLPDDAMLVVQPIVDKMKT